MKKLFLSLLSLFMCVLLTLLCSCGGKMVSQSDTTATQPSQDAQIAELMRQLEALRASNREQDEEYRALLSELQAALESLAATSGADTDPGETGTGDQTGTSTDTTVTNQGRFTYEIHGTYATITGFTGTEDHIVIPSQIDGYTVKSIGERAFSSSACKSITVSDGILTLDWFAFYGCLALKEIFLPSSIIDIGYGAFDGCNKGLTVICPDNSYALAYAKSYGLPFRLS